MLIKSSRGCKVNVGKRARNEDLGLTDLCAEHALGTGVEARAAAYLQCQLTDGRTLWGCGVDEDVGTASVLAVLSAANRARRLGKIP